MKIASRVLGPCIFVVALVTVATIAGCGDEAPHPAPSPGSSDGGAPPASKGTGTSTATTPVGTGNTPAPPVGGW